MFCWWLLSVFFFAISRGEYSVSEYKPTTFGCSAILTFEGTETPSTYTSVVAEMLFNSSDILRIRLSPDVQEGQQAPYQIPDVVFWNNNIPADEMQGVKDPNYAVTVSNAGLAVTDKTTAYPLLSLMNLTLEENFVQFTTKVAEGSYISGYGEHNYNYFLNRDEVVDLSLWNTDNYIPWQKPLYGYQPVVFVNNPSIPLYFALVWVNSNAQRLHIDRTNLTFTSVGGTVNVVVIVGATPLEVLKNYHKMIGTSHVPPYWVLGTHQCRWGYHNISETAQVVAKYAGSLIPLETMWNDIDYMQDFRVFTLDPDRFPADEVKAFVDQLHSNHQHYMQIIDPGIATQYNYSAFESGLNQSVFMTLNGEPLVGVVWPGWTAFPDFTSYSTADWWEKSMVDYFNDVNLDGMWIDMNEAASFCGGSCPIPFGTRFPVDWAHNNWATFNDDVCLANGCTSVNNSLNFPSFNPLTNGNNLTTKTPDMNADLAMGKYYDTKAFYGMMQAKATYDALLTMKGTRPFVLTRASYLGSGRYTAHWTGDNNASWAPRTQGIADSIQGVLASNLWGMTTVGADIGGFIGTSSDELVTRWYQLGVYYTFTRNHNDLASAPQEPYMFSNQAQDTIRDSISDRYRLLPYLFTELLRSYVLGGPVLMHPSVMFPLDAATYKETTTFMFGRSIFVIPVVVPTYKGGNHVTAYIPQGIWYHLWTGEKVNGAAQQLFETPLYSPIPVLVLGGAAIPLHIDAKMTTKATRESGVTILCALAPDGTAIGELWNDDMKDSPISPTGVELVRREFRCEGTMEGGSVVSSDAWKNNTSTPTLLPHDLPKPANITLYFQDKETAAQILKSQFTLNGETFIPSVLSVEGTVGVIQLPANVDATCVFNLEWSPNTRKPAAPESSSNVGYIIALVLISIVAAAALVGIVYYKKRVTEEQSFLL